MQLRLAAAVATACVTLTGVGFASAASPTGAPAVAPEYSSGRVVVQYKAGVSAAAQVALEKASGAGRVSSIRDLGVQVLSVPAGAEARVVAALQKSGQATFAERDVLGHTTATADDTYFPQQWGLAKVNGPAAWDTTTGTASTVIAVLDTGVDPNHPDLGRLLPGYDFVNADSNPADDNGHGTEATGVAAATGNNATGVAGACFSCSVLPVKVADSTGSALWSNVANGITWATDHGADIISMSLAGTSGSSALSSAVTYAHDHGVLLVAAAGNNGSSTPMYPAAYSPVISVAGTNTTDGLYSWSNYGSWVDVAAPGCDYTTVMNAAYGSFCGTSAATPMVAGVLGLLRSVAPTATVADLENALTSAATPIGTLVANGRIDAAASLAALGVAPAPTASPSASPSPTASASPSPTPTGTPTSAPIPSPSASPTPTTTTTSYSDSLNAKVTSRSYGQGTGSLHLSLTQNKAAALTLAVRDESGTVMAQTTGIGSLTLDATVNGAACSLVVSGDGTRTSYALSVVRTA